MELNIALPYDPVIPLLDIYPEKTIIQKDYLKESDQVSIYWVPHRESGNSLVSGRHLPHPTEEEIDSERGRDSPKVTRHVGSRAGFRGPSPFCLAEGS